MPTQNVEYYVGFDAAHDPEKAHAIWRILSAHAPKRIALSPELWPPLPRPFHDEIPGSYVSLFMQYKRAIFQDHWRAKDLERIGGPYFQVSVTGHQQRRLEDLETAVQARAVARAAASFPPPSRQRRVSVVVPHHPVLSLQRNGACIMALDLYAEVTNQITAMLDKGGEV